MIRVKPAHIRTPLSAKSAAAPVYEFVGRHLLVSYCGCDEKALLDVAGLRQAMASGIQASGATILNSTEHVFPEGGMTMLFLLSESHASIHTYPEHGSCFLDLFTCGTNCRAEAFEAVMRKHLRPRLANCRVWVRNQGMESDQFNVA